MIQSLIHTTENNNLYIYDGQRRLSMLIHPEFRTAYENSTDVNSYYVKKYEYLKEHSFFTEIKSANFETVKKSMVKESIIQVPQIVFEVTDSCNLNCTYCGYGEFYEVFDARNHNNINIRYAKKFLKYIYDLKLKNNRNKLIIGFYGGEPLLNINFIKQIVEIANQLNAEKKMDIVYSMTTNATLIHKHIDFLVANKFDLLISLDGNEENQSYRVFSKNNKNSFWKVIENIDLIQRDYPEYFVNYVSFNAVLHNRSSVKEIYEFIYTRYQIEKYHLRPVYTKDNIGFFKENVFLSKEDILSASMSIKDFFSRQSINMHDFGKINIMPNGDVYANVNHPALGNIYMHSIHEIVYKEIEKGVSWFRIRNQAPCNDCIYQWLCPPPSNHEIAIGRPNLCHVKQ